MTALATTSNPACTVKPPAMKAEPMRRGRGPAIVNSRAMIVNGWVPLMSPLITSVWTRFPTG